MSGTRPEFAEGFKAADGRRAIWYDICIYFFVQCQVENLCNRFRLRLTVEHMKG